MAHNIAMINGMDSVFTGRGLKPWHNLGVTIEGTAQWQEAIKLAHLDWEVEKERLYSKSSQPVDSWGIFRNTDRAFLGAVGERYEPIQNRQAFQFVDDLIGDNGAHYDSAGALGNGEVIWCSAYLPAAGFDVVEGDGHRCYLLFKTSHDGSLAAVCKLTSVRVVCNNTLNMALNQKGQDMKIKHTVNAAQRMSVAHNLLLSGQKTAALLLEKFKLLAGKKVTKESMEGIMSRLFPGDENGDLATKSKNNIRSVLELYESNDSNAFPEIRGSAYNLLNAVTEYTDKLRTAKGGGVQFMDRARAESALFGSGETFKNNAFEYIYEAAQAMPSMPTYTPMSQRINPVVPSPVFGGGDRPVSILDSILDTM